MVSSGERARRVCMFVYNNMLHDARVRREARTLAEAGYVVTVLAVHEPGRTQRSETHRVGGGEATPISFHIVRLSRSILGISRREITARLRKQTVTPLPPRSPGGGDRPLRRSWRSRALGLLETAVRLSVYPLRRVLVYLRFVRAALAAKADIYHAHDLNTLLMAWTASRLRRTPLIYDTHEVATDRAGMGFRWWACFLERALIHRAERVICTNQTRADFTQRRYGIVPPVVLRNFPRYVEPQPSRLMHERLSLPPDTRIVLYQGGVQPQRGLEQLMEAAPDIQGGVVVVLGSGRLKPLLMQRAMQLGLEDRVFFHEAVPVGELPNWTACAHVGLQVLQNTCFNHYSSLSNKLLEYVMAGVPVVASDLPEMRRVIEDTGAGLVIEASDPHAIAAAVNRLLADEALRARMSEKARAARRRYCWEAEQHILLRLYDDIFAPRHTPAT